MLYTVGFGAGATVPPLRKSLESTRSHRRPGVLPAQTGELDRCSIEIVAGAGQPVRAFVRRRRTPAQDSGWRNIRVRVRKGKYEIRARRGYQAHWSTAGGEE